MEFIRHTFKLPPSLIIMYNNKLKKYNLDSKLYINCLLAQEFLPYEEAIEWIKNNYPEYLKFPVELEEYCFEKEEPEKINLYIETSFLDKLKNHKMSIGKMMQYIFMYELTKETEYRQFRHLEGDQDFTDKLINSEGILQRVKNYDLQVENTETTFDTPPEVSKREYNRNKQVSAFAGVKRNFFF